MHARALGMIASRLAVARAKGAHGRGVWGLHGLHMPGRSQVCMRLGRTVHIPASPS